MSKVARSYIFWVRRSSDLDHTAPIIYGLIKNGVKPDLIKYFIQSPHYSTKFLLKDPRVKFLEKKGIVIKKTLFFRFFNLMASLPYSEFKSSLDRLLFKVYANLLFIGIKINSINVMDLSSSYENQYVVKKLRLRGIGTIAIPHGISLFNGHKDSEEWKRLYPNSNPNPLDFNDLVVMPNKLSKSLLCTNLAEEKIRTLGSARYSKEWLEVLACIYRDFDLNLKSDNKINVLFLLEKQENYGFGTKVNFYPDLLKTLSFLDSNPAINLFIKPHPAMHPSERPFYEDLNSPIFFSDQVPTYKLILESNIVIGTDTSSLADAIILNKNILVLSFCSVFLTILKNYDLKGIMSSYNEFINKFENIIERPKENFFNTYKNRNFIKENIGDGDVLKEYFSLLSSFEIKNK